MSSTLVETRPHPPPPEEISPELALVCPDTRRHARGLLPDRDPYAFLRGESREHEAADLVPEPEGFPALRLVPPAPEPASCVAVERTAELPATPVPSAQAAERVARPPAPPGRPWAAEPSRITPAPAPAAPTPPPDVAAMEPDEEQSTFLAYAGRELVMLAIAATTTVVGLVAGMTIIDVFFVR